MRSPQYLLGMMVILTEDETQRLRAYVVRVGHCGRAMASLGISEATFGAARGYGRMRATTREKILRALDREQA